LLPIRWLCEKESPYGIATPVVNQIRECSEIAATQLFKYTLPIMFQKKLHVPRTKQEYQETVDLLDNLIDEVGENEERPMASLMEILGVLIEKYEDDHIPELMDMQQRLKAGG
jgi:HTH-type transcriptional regulator/antitoxin HigA